MSQSFLSSGSNQKKSIQKAKVNSSEEDQQSAYVVDAGTEDCGSPQPDGGYEIPALVSACLTSIRFSNQLVAATL